MSYVPLLLLGGAVLLLGGKKKKKSSASACPPLVVLSLGSIPAKTIIIPYETGEIEINIFEIAYNEAKVGSRNIVAMTRKTLAHVLPVPCFGDPSVVVNVRAKDGEIMKIPAPEVFYRVGHSIAEDLWNINMIDKPKALQLVDKLDMWWHDNMGNTPVPNT